MNQYDHLKNKLHNYKVEIDKEKLWAKTSHAIPQRKRRRAIPIMIIGTLVIAAWLLYSTSLGPTSKRSISNAKSSINDTTQLAQNLSYNSQENKNEWKETPHKTLRVLSSKLNRSVAQLKEVLNPLPEENFTNRFIEGENITFESNENQILKSQILPLFPKGRQNIFHRFLAVPLSERNTEAQSDIPIQIHNENQNENINTQNDHSFKKFIIPEYTDRDVNVPVTYLFKVVSPITITENSELAASSLKPDIRPLTGRFLQSLQMVQGIGVSTVKIHSLTPEAEQYAALLEAKLRSLEVMTTTVSANFNLPERFLLETGLQFSRLSTVIDHEWEIDERIHEEGVTTIIIDENGVPQSVTGSRDVTRTTLHKAKRFTTHQHIDFVVGLHRVILNEKRISMNAFVKGAYNLSYDAKGTMLDINGSLVGFSKEENPFRINSPFSFGGGLQMLYQIDPHWSLSGNFTFDPLRYRLKVENVPVKFIHSGLSFGLGLAYVL